jgi:DNA-binding response OmpR family regulator
LNRTSPRVLIVEDDTTTAHMIAKIFELWKWDTAKAYTVASAMSLLDEVPYDLVVLDLMLPDGSGVDVLRKIRDRKCPAAVAVSTSKMIDEVGDVLELKPDQLNFKPFIFEPLREMAQNIYDRFYCRKRALAHTGG